MVTPKGSMSTEGETFQVCPTLQVLDASTLGDAEDVKLLIKLLPHTLQHLAVDSSDCLHDPLSQLWQITWRRGQMCKCPLCHVIYRLLQELD
jgi:hypothetical protein